MDEASLIVIGSDDDDSDSDEVVYIESEELDDTDDDVIFVSKTKQALKPITIDEKVDESKIVTIGDDQHMDIANDQELGFACTDPNKLVEESKLRVGEGPLVFKREPSLRQALSISTEFSFSLTLEEEKPKREVAAGDISGSVDGATTSQSSVTCDPALGQANLVGGMVKGAGSGLVTSPKDFRIHSLWDAEAGRNALSKPGGGSPKMLHRTEDACSAEGDLIQSALLSELKCNVSCQKPDGLIYRCLDSKNSPFQADCLTKLANSHSVDTPVNQETVSRSGSGGSYTVLPPPKKRVKVENTDISYTVTPKNCAACRCAVLDRKGSHCLQNHVTCCRCLEDRVKIVLSGKSKEKTVRCLSTNCDSFYTISELRHSLSPMIVEVLEEILEQEYVDFISNMLLKSSSLDKHSAQDGTAGGSNSCELPTNSSPLVSRKIDDFPDTWEEMDPKLSYKLFPLKPDSVEYQKVSQKFLSTMMFPSADVVKISRIQNAILWKYYMLKKMEMVQENDGLNVEERQLFHGTKSKVLDPICRKGFDWRVCGKHGTVYGHGSYFARDSYYSHQFTDDMRTRRHHTSPNSTRNNMAARIFAYVSSQVQNLGTNGRTSSFQNPPNPKLGMSLNSRQYLPPPPYSAVPGVGGAGGLLTQGTRSGADNALLSKFSIADKRQAITTQSPCSHLGLSSAPALNQSQGSSLRMQPISVSVLHQPNMTTNHGLAQPSSMKLASQQVAMTSGQNQTSQPLATDTMLIHSGLLVPVQQNGTQSLKLPAPVTIPQPKTVLPQLNSSTLALLNLNHQGAQDMNLPGGVAIQDIEASSMLTANARKMFFARVLVGKYTGGNSSLKKPPPLYPCTEPFGKCYDSCVDNIWEPRIFVIFDSAQAYPEYLIEYNQLS